MINNPPAGFEQYQSFDSAKAVRFGNVKMTLLLESTADIQYYITPQDEIIVYYVQNKTENLFKKINKDGNIIDSLTIRAKPLNIVFVSGYIINKKTCQYYKWSFDGSNHAHQITQLNVGLEWDIKKQQEQVSKITNASLWVLIDYGYIDPTPQKPAGDELPTTQTMTTYAMLNYFLNDNCFRLYTTLDVTDRFPYTYTEKLLLNNPFKHYNSKVPGGKEITQSPFIKYRYYQKLKLEKVRFSGGGGNAPGFDVMLYHANLFIDVLFRNDTLRLKEFLYEFKDQSSSAIRIDGESIGTLTKNKAQPPAIMEGYMYYTNDNLAYALFTNNDKKLYIIK